MPLSLIVKGKNMQIKILLTLICLLAGCSINLTDNNTREGVYSIEKDFGYLFDRSEKGSYKVYTKENPSNFRTISESEPYRHKTNRIPLKQGVDFGFRIELKGISNYKVKVLTFVIRHPEMLRPDGYYSSGYIGEREFHYDPEWGFYYDWSYKLEHDFELVEGDWNIEVKYEGSTIYGKTFKVRKKYL